MKTFIYRFLLHSTATKLSAILIFVGGCISLFHVEKELLPVYSADVVSVRVSDRGASINEIEKLIVQPFESEIGAITGVHSVTSYLYNEGAKIRVELSPGSDRYALSTQIQAKISGIKNLPASMSEPEVRLGDYREPIVTLVVYGDKSAIEIQRFAKRIKGQLLVATEIQDVEIGSRSEEVVIKINPESLIPLDLSLMEIVSQVRAYTSVYSAGGIELNGESIRVGVGRGITTIAEIENMPLRIGSASSVLLKDIAVVSESLAVGEERNFFDGLPSNRIYVYSTPGVVPGDVSSAVGAAVADLQEYLPSDVNLDVLRDSSSNYKQVVSSLFVSLALSTILVLVLLSLFIDYRLSIWVAFGMGLSLFGGLMFFPLVGLSINLMTLNAIVLIIGMLVDDAVIVGESVFSEIQKGGDTVQAAYRGVARVFSPLTFAVATSVISFLPLMYLDPEMRYFFGAFPVVVFLCLFVSWFDACFLLPKHLSQVDINKQSSFGKFVEVFQRPCVAFLNLKMCAFYSKLSNRICERPQLFSVIALLVAVTSLVFIFFNSQHRMKYWPSLDGLSTSFSVTFGSEATQGDIVREESDIRSRITSGLRTIGAEDDVIAIETIFRGRELEFVTWLRPRSDRINQKQDIKNAIKRKVNRSPARSVLWNSGKAKKIKTDDNEILVDVKGPNGSSVARAVSDLETILLNIKGVDEVSNYIDRGVEQWWVSVNRYGVSLGLSDEILGRSLYASITGVVASKLHTDNYESDLIVTFNREAQANLSSLSKILVRTPSGEYVTLGEVANLDKKTASGVATRIDSMRVESVLLSLENSSNKSEMMAHLKNSVFPSFIRNHPDAVIDFSGTEIKVRNSLSILKTSFIIVVVGIFCLLSLHLQRFLLPVMIISSIPFCMLCSLIGHWVFGVQLAIVSLIGMLAVSGMAINDCLLLVSTANEYRAKEYSVRQAVLLAASNRFRPIVLTTVTTFFGVLPLMFDLNLESARVAPIAISVGFGILGATVYTLLFGPAIYIMLEKNRLKKIR